MADQQDNEENISKPEMDRWLIEIFFALFSLADPHVCTQQYHVFLIVSCTCPLVSHLCLALGECLALTLTSENSGNISNYNANTFQAFQILM